MFRVITEISIESFFQQAAMMLFLALGTACLAVFFRKCQQEDMIFSWYGRWLSRWDYETYVDNTVSETFGEKLMDKLKHPLGYCPYCNGFWVGLVVWVLYYQHISLTFLLFAGFNYLFTALILKKGVLK